MNNLEKISVVGGGTAGLLSALILKTRYPNIEINLIQSSKIGIIGVGEGSTEHWNEFIKFIGVSWRSIITECGATFKSGIMFKGWSKEPFLHSIGTETELHYGQTTPVYSKLVSDNADKELFNPSNVWRNQIFTSFLDMDSQPPYNQFHFDTHKLNIFLQKCAIEKNIKIFDDEIVDVILNDNGSIKTVNSSTTEYKSDFYIDCTGFRKILIGKLGAKWQSYKKYLKMKSAIVFPTKNDSEIPLWTLAKTMDYGWRFQIPVQGRYGNGYIFDSDYITADQAKDEIDKEFKEDIEISKQINFDPGVLNNVWIKNCVAVGLSGNFIEPLEATSIGTSIQQMFLLMHRLPNYTQKTIDKYNNDISSLMENIRDFVILHYITKKDNSRFWVDLQHQDIPESLSERLERFKYNLPIEEDFNDTTTYRLFGSAHYIHIMNGLNLFNRDSIKKEYELLSNSVKANVENYITYKFNNDVRSPKISHKEFIQKVISPN